MVNTSRMFRVISKTISAVLITAVVLTAVLTVGVRLVGLTPYTVLSGSMEPVYRVGSVIYVAETEPEELELGDPLTYRMSNGTVVTHRIVEINLDEALGQPSFITQGDANLTPDGTPVLAQNIIGKPLFSIPYLGYVSDFVKKPQGLFVVVAVCALALIISVLTDMLFPKKREEQCDPDSEQERE